MEAGRGPGQGLWPRGVPSSTLVTHRYSYLPHGQEVEELRNSQGRVALGVQKQSRLLEEVIPKLGPDNRVGEVERF